MNILKRIFKNEKELPKRYFARHITAGTVRYGDELYLVTNEALKRMNNSFEGKPVYVGHQDVNLENIKEQADGYVVKSFYNELDGSWWLELIVNGDKAHEAIRKGWGVSNCYTPTEYGGGGSYHNQDYVKEVLNGEYEHLAIVSNPRYEESKIMTPEEFKKFNEEKRLELERINNSKGIEEMDIEEVKTLINSILDERLKNSEKEEEKEEKENACSETEDEHKENACDKKNEEEEKEEDKKENSDSESDSETKENSDDSEADKKDEEDKKEDSKKNEKVDKRELIRRIMAVAKESGADDEEVRTIAGWAEKLSYDGSEASKKDNAKTETKENSKDYFEELRNAKRNHFENSCNVIQTQASALELGRQRYGSK